MSNYYVTAVIEANEGVDLELVRSELKELARETIKEVDCFLFDVREVVSEEGVFVLWEEFSSKEALDYHFTLKHTIKYVDQDLTKIRSAVFSSEI